MLHIALSIGSELIDAIHSSILPLKYLIPTLSTVRTWFFNKLIRLSNSQLALISSRIVVYRRSVVKDVVYCFAY